METRVRYIVVGLFTLVVGFALLFFVLWMQSDGSLRGRQDVRIRFAGPAPGLRVGAAVTFNGIRVGEVTRVSLDPDDPNAIEARVSIDATTPLSSTTQVSLDTQGLMGSPYVSLYGGSSDRLLRIGRNAPFPVLTAPAGSSLTLDSHKAVVQIQNLLKENAAPLHETITNIQTFSAALARNADRVDGILAGIERLTGTGEKQNPPATFDLAAPTFRDLLANVREAKLVIPDPTCVVILDTQRFMTQTPDGQLAPQGTQWSDTIPKLVQKRLLQTFENARYRFANPPTDGLEPDYQLLIDIRSFQIVEGNDPMAKVQMGARVLSRGGQILGAQVVEGSAGATSSNGSEAAGAMSQAFAVAAHDLIVWYTQTLEREPREEITPLKPDGQ
jgi:phospholipid/cholesterol/gamma-HCH transport system substrate-binding protein